VIDEAAAQSAVAAGLTVIGPLSGDRHPAPSLKAADSGRRTEVG
jgi:hypothetical protein